MVIGLLSIPAKPIDHGHTGQTKGMAEGMGQLFGQCQSINSKRKGLIANISAGASKIEYYNPVFRMAMSAIDRMTAAVADDLKPYDVHAVSIWPRWVRTERVLMAAENDQLGFDVSREDLEQSDTPEFTGRAIVHLALDPELSTRSGQTFPLLQLAHDYGFSDLDGSVVELDEFSADWADRLARISLILREESG